MKLRIQNGRLIDPSQDIDTVTDLFVDNQKIVAIGEAPEGFEDAEVVDASGQWILPGLVDLAVALREPGMTQKGNIATEGRAAVSGGITTLVCPPDTRPIVDTPAVAALIQDKADDAGMANVFPLGALTQGLEGAQLSNMVALTDVVSRYQIIVIQWQAPRCCLVRLNMPRHMICWWFFILMRRAFRKAVVPMKV